jgi:squalene synthase HpnC
MEESLIKSSFKYCEIIAKNHYENFPVASLLIPKEKRKYIYCIYAFARAADDFADELDIEGGKEKRLSLLNEWNQKLIDCFTGKTYDPIFIALNKTISDCEIPVEPLENLLKAFKQDVIKNRYQDFNEILDYCANSANPIGRLVLMIMGLNNSRLFAISDNICTALQLTNFWQDIEIDLRKDRIYLPADDMARFEVTEEQLLNKKCDNNFKNLLRYEIERTEKLFNEGKELIIRSKTEENLRVLKKELILIWFGGKMILNKIRISDYDVFNKRPEITFFDKIKLFSKTFFS